MSWLDLSLGQSSSALSDIPTRAPFTKTSIGKPDSPGISIVVLGLMAGISALLVPSRMLLSDGPPNDSSVFAYIGWAMNQGLKPYRDVWDHKGPLLYYLQFAGFRLHSASTVGIGLLELVAWALAFFLLYRIIASFASRRVGFGIAILSIVFVTHFSEGGNLCESWALVPLATAHYLAWRWSQRISLTWCAPLLSACFACLVWLRPNMAVYPVVAMLALLYESRRAQRPQTAVRQLAWAGVSALGLSGVILAPLYRFGVFGEFFTAYVQYNAAYSHALPMPVRLEHTAKLLILLFTSALAMLATAGWAFRLKRPTTTTTAAAAPSLYLRILLWSFPLEIVAATLSGRDYPHYVLPLFPTAAILAGWFLAEIESSANRKPYGTALALALLTGFMPYSLALYKQDFSESSAPPVQYLRLIRFIKQATNPQDKIMVIGGAEAAYITYRAQRLPASRYLYQYALVDPANAAAPAQRQQFMRDLVQNRPAVIISGNPLVGLLCTSEPECRRLNGHLALSDYGYDPRVLPELLRVFIDSEYRMVQEPTFDGIHVFLRRDLHPPTE